MLRAKIAIEDISSVTVLVMITNYGELSVNTRKSKNGSKKRHNLEK